MLWTQVARASIFAMVASAMTPLRQANGTNDGIHLAISPSCGLLGGNYANVNAGIDLLNVRTIVSFGDSYTDGGRHDGGPLAPPVFIPPNPSAGGRVTNGPLWLEDLADDFNLALKDYAVAGAVVNASLWPSDTGRSDFVNQSALFLSQSNNLDPDTTLYSIFFGINDWHASMVDGDHLPEAAANLLQRIDLLASPPTNGRLFMVLDDYGGENSTASGEAWRQKVFDGLSQLHNNKGVSVAYIDFSPIWRAVKLSDPGFAAFGYTDDGSCLPTDDQTTLAGECSDPAHTFYWFSGHPSKETHRIMANWIERIMVECTTK